MSPDPTKAQAKKMVLVSVGALLIIALYRSEKGSTGDAGLGTLYRRVWGVSVLSMFLAFAADFAPQVAGPFAALTVLGSLTKGGDQAFINLLANLGKPGSGAPANPRQAGPVGTKGPVGTNSGGTPSGKPATSPPPGVTGPQVG